jgi:oligopeptide/dipeptide ABC transporter ATP-binding protein
MTSILEVRNVATYFPLRYGLLDTMAKRKKLFVRAVDGISLNVGYNETLGLVGESGSGKTTLGRTVLMLQRPTEGQIMFKGREISNLQGEKLRQIRKEMQIVFQNPNSSLNPRHHVRDILSEPLKAFNSNVNKDFEDQIAKVLQLVGLSYEAVDKFPHEFSGGQRQRIAVARALVLNPQFLVLDEPTSALDSSVQAQILNLLRDIQKELNLSYLFITHNINVVKYVADRIAVMYAGKIIEIGKTQEVLEASLHPYTVALSSSVPVPDPRKSSHVAELSGEAPSPINPPQGCRFHPRCKYAQEICRTNEPILREMQEGHWAACHLIERVASDTSRRRAEIQPNPS